MITVTVSCSRCWSYIYYDAKIYLPNRLTHSYCLCEKCFAIEDAQIKKLRKQSEESKAKIREMFHQNQQLAEKVRIFNEENCLPLWQIGQVLSLFLRKDVLMVMHQYFHLIAKVKSKQPKLADSANISVRKTQQKCSKYLQELVKEQIQTLLGSIKSQTKSCQSLLDHASDYLQATESEMSNIKNMSFLTQDQSKQQEEVDQAVAKQHQNLNILLLKEEQDQILSIIRSRIHTLNTRTQALQSLFKFQESYANNRQSYCNECHVEKSSKKQSSYVINLTPDYTQYFKRTQPQYFRKPK